MMETTTDEMPFADRDRIGFSFGWTRPESSALSVQSLGSLSTGRCPLIELRTAEALRDEPHAGASEPDQGCSQEDAIAGEVLISSSHFRMNTP
jgi:hypothetical protein